MELGGEQRDDESVVTVLQSRAEQGRAKPAAAGTDSQGRGHSCARCRRDTGTGLVVGTSTA